MLHSFDKQSFYDSLDCDYQNCHDSAMFAAYQGMSLGKSYWCRGLVTVAAPKAFPYRCHTNNSNSYQVDDMLLISIAEIWEIGETYFFLLAFSSHDFNI